MIGSFRSKTIFILVFFYFFCTNTTFGQLDSLVSVVETLSEGEEKARVYLTIAFYLYNSKPQESLEYSEKGLDLSNKLDFDFGRAKSYYLQAAAYDVKGESQKAISNADKAVVFFQKADKDSGVSSAHTLRATIYTNLGMYEKSSKILLEVLALNEKQGDEIGMAYTMQSLGIVFENFEDYESAKKYYLRAIKIFEKDKDDYQISNTYILLSNTVTEPQEKLKYLNLGLDFANSIEDPFLLSLAYTNLGSYYYRKKDYPKAISTTHKSLSYAENAGIVRSMVYAYNNLGDYKQLVNELDSAIFFLEKGASLAEKHHFQKEKEEAYTFLTELYKRKGNYKQALTYIEMASAVNDSLYDDKINLQLQTNAAKFEFEKNERKITEQQLELANSKNIRNQILLFSILLISIIAGFSQWYVYRQNKKKQFVENESKRLKELDQLKTDFFTNLAHELRTPLTLILSPLSDVILAIKSKAEKRKLQIVKNNAERLMRLVNEIMNVSKAESGISKLNKSNVILPSFINRVFYSFESWAKLRKVDFQISMNLNEGLVAILDRDKTEKIINNLLSNALKYTKSGGHVLMNVIHNDNQLQIEIKDDGMGIHSDDQAHVFNRFYQAKHGKSPLQGGTGIGLALSKELAMSMNGEITFTSQLGKGSTFVFSFPLEIVDAVAAKQTTTEVYIKEELPFVPTYQPLTINGDKPKILVVEDNLEMSRYLVEILSDDFHCTTAMDGEEALKQLDKNTYDCITSDVMMPNMDGFELRENINKRQEWRQIPFLLLTARYMENDKVRGFRLGIDDYITKPFSTLELRARMHNLISNKLERDDFMKNEQIGKGENVQLSADQKLLKLIEKAIFKNLDNPDFSVSDLSKEVAYTSSNLLRIIKKLTGFSTVAFILEIRLQKARELLEKGLCSTITEVQMTVGIGSLPYFTRKFTKRFGVNPKDIRK